MKRLRARFRAYSKTTARNNKTNKETPVPMNTGRHCFCSYHLGLYNDYNLTTKRLNHGTVGTMKQNYESVVDPEEAEKFFQTFPRDVWTRRISAKRQETKERWKKIGVASTLERKFYKEVVENFLLNQWFEFCVFNNLTGIEAEQSYDDQTPVRIGSEDYLLKKDSIQKEFLRLKKGNKIRKETPARAWLPEELFGKFEALKFFKA